MVEQIKAEYGEENVEVEWLPYLLRPNMRIDAEDEPQLELIRSRLTELLAKYPDTKLFITQGYICRNSKGEVDNLKRGGSDYTASLVAAATYSTVCEIWTDIDGME